MGDSLIRRNAAEGLAVVFARCLLSITVALMILSAPAVARPLADVKRTGVLTAFVYADYAPYSWRSEEKIQGIDADVARELAAALGVRPQFLMRQADENVDDDLRINIWKGDLIHRQSADVMLHVPYDKVLQERADGRAVLLAPYFSEQVAVVFDADVIPDVKTFGRFVTRPIAVELDTAGDFFLSIAFKGQLHQSIRRGRTLMDAIAIFESGEAPALFASRAQAEWVIHRNKGRNYRLAQPPAPGLVRRQWPVGIAVKGDSRDLGEALENALNRLAESGRLREICAKYGVTWQAPDAR